MWGGGIEVEGWIGGLKEFKSARLSAELRGEEGWRTSTVGGGGGGGWCASKALRAQRLNALRASSVYSVFEDEKTKG